MHLQFSCQTVASNHGQQTTQSNKEKGRNVVHLVFFSFPQETAASSGVSAMPTFVFFRSGSKIDSLRGADPNALEEKIKKWYGAGEEDEDEPAVKGHVSIHDLTHFFQCGKCHLVCEVYRIITDK